MNLTETRLGPIRLAAGVRPLNTGTFLFAAFLSVAMTTFVSAIQPYILTVNIGLAVEEQGRVSGQMVFYGELVLLSLSSLMGIWSDRIGRRPVFIVGMVILAAGYLLYGFVNSVGTLTAVRVFMALGIAAVNVMVSALMVDYPAEASRGKLAGATGAAIGLGAILIGVLFLQLPKLYAAGGADTLWAGRLALFTMAVLCVVLGIALK